MTLNDFLKSHVDPDLQLPILNEEQWKEAHSIWTPDEFREGLARFIIENKPPYPRKISIQDPQQADNRFLELCTLDMEKYIKPKNQTRDVMEKFDDYRRPYETHGLGVIDCGSVNRPDFVLLSSFNSTG